MSKRNQVIKTCLEIDKDDNVHKAISPEIVMTSSFYSENYDELVVNSQAEFDHYVYTRGMNPTTHQLEKILSKLEGGERCKVFGSGMGAISATLQTFLKSGSHIVVVNTVYSTTMKYIKNIEKFDVSYTVVNSHDEKDILAAIKPNTSIIYMESPSSQKFEIINIKKITKIAREKNILTMIDNTWATPLFQRPIEHGVDLVLHSCSKYIGGHSDIVCGAVVGSEVLVREIEKTGYLMLGSTCSPLNSFLAIRGIRTLPVRMDKHNANIIEVIEYMRDDPRIDVIYHPYARQRKLSEEVLEGYGSLMAITLADKDTERLKKFVDNLQTFLIGVSWGGFESMVLPSFKGEYTQTMKDRGLDITHTRMFIGLMEAEDIIADIKQALDIAYYKI